MLKAIDTLYNGNYFRSRMEARWAVFFDAAGIQYQYEPEGFDLGNGIKYLPDFYLPQFKCYAEVKPGILSHEEDIIRHSDYKKWHLFTKEKELIFLFGNPHTRPFLKMPFQDYKKYNNWCEFFNDWYIENETLMYLNDWRFWYASTSDEGNYGHELEKFVLAATIKRFEHNGK